MKYKENETLKETTATELSKEETPADTLTTDKETLYQSIRKIIDLRIKILEDSLTDLKDAFTQLEGLYNEKDD